MWKVTFQGELLPVERSILASDLSEPFLHRFSRTIPPKGPGEPAPRVELIGEPGLTLLIAFLQISLIRIAPQPRTLPLRVGRSFSPIQSLSISTRIPFS